MTCDVLKIECPARDASGAIFSRKDCLVNFLLYLILLLILLVSRCAG